MGIYLSNGEENTCGVCIEVYLLETGEKIAASDTVLPGWRLEKLQLEKELAAGEYHCLVRCLFYTMDENISLGTTTRQMLLTVT